MCLYVNRPLGRNYAHWSSEVKFFNCLFNFAIILPLSLFLSERSAIRVWSFKILISLVITIRSFLLFIFMYGRMCRTRTALHHPKWRVLPLHYTLYILVGTGEWSRTTVTSVSERHNNRYMTPAYTRRIKITYQFPKRMLIHKLLKPSLCTVSYIAAGVPASSESLFCSLGLTI